MIIILKELIRWYFENTCKILNLCIYTFFDRRDLIPKFRENKPQAAVLMNSMRSMGYTFESAIADLVDNSISAHATEVKICFPIDPADCYLAICDNGTGMSETDLFDAMKYGSENKSSNRNEADLGRFGLGLKSASLSQCRRLSVASKKDGIITAYIWDMDVVIKNKNWDMIECSDEQICSLKCISYLDDKENGTVVVWENFDIIKKNSGDVYAELSILSESVSEYLSLIFHRYINRDGKNKLHITINNFELKGKDPFLENHKKTSIRRRVELPVIDSQGIERMVIAQPFVLPFQKDLSEEDKKMSGGLENYRTSQGYYIYRNERLIVWGTWFNRRKDELTKYARIRVDIPNTLDDIWSIDIKKQHAKIPKQIQKRLTRAVDEAMDIAVKTQKYRGRVDKADDNIEYIWDRIKERGENYTYKINRNAKVFDLIKSQVNDSVWNQFDMILEEIEQAVPYQQIYVDKSQNVINEDVDDKEERMAEIEEKAEILIRQALSFGVNDKNTIIDNLFRSEPFCMYPELKQKMMEK